MDAEETGPQTAQGKESVPVFLGRSLVSSGIMNTVSPFELGPLRSKAPVSGDEASGYLSHCRYLRPGCRRHVPWEGENKVASITWTTYRALSFTSVKLAVLELCNHMCRDSPCRHYILTGALRPTG